MKEPTATTPAAALVPRTFWEYLRSFGPGIVIVLTWLGAGDVLDMGLAGANYGYALMWMLVLSLGFRLIFVQSIARYQLCNPRGEGVLDGLVRLNRAYAPLLLVASFIMGNFYLGYLSKGTGEVLKHLCGFGEIWQWAIVGNAVALVLIYQPVYTVLEWVFKFFLAVLTISFVGSAFWVGFNPAGLLQGMYRLEMPGHVGDYDPLLIALAMIGAVGGSILNLAYPYFLDAKGWRGPQYRNVQFYDFLLAMVMMVVLNLAIWTLGAEVLFPDRKISVLNDFASLLTGVIGPVGGTLFYLGIFSAIYTSVIGNTAGLAYIGAHAWQRWRSGEIIDTKTLPKHRMYHAIVLWSLVSSLIWSVPGMPDFITLTLVANSLHVVLLPLLAGGLWWITSNPQYIGAEYRNRWWVNVVMAVLFVLAILGAYHTLGAIKGFIFPPAVASLSQLI